MKKLLLPLLFAFLFLFESIFVQFLPEKVFGFESILVPHFLFAAILLLTLYFDMKQGIIYGMIFGLLFDIVYTEILGIYLFLYPLITYLITKIMHVIQLNLGTAFLATLLGIAMLELGSYEMNSIIHITDLDFMTFIHLRFYPTMILNTVFVLLAGYPLKRQFEKSAQALDE